MSTSTKAGHTLAKVLGIKTNYRKAADPITRGESAYSLDSADTYVEEEPRTADFFREHAVTGKGAAHYAYSLVPFIHWITRYNLQWLTGDLVAGITVGAVVVPQSMAYAALAELPVEFGLYSSFMGVLIYWFFATSKDITIGPVAVLSTVTGNVVTKVLSEHPEYKKEPWVIASALAIITGAIVTFIGLIRLGRIVDFISLPAISAFMTGSAINIAAGQVPTMMGITGFNTRDTTYKVIINTLKGLPHTKLDAAMGLTALTMLYLIRSACNFAAKKNPARAKTFFFISTLRTAFVILLYTMISWLANRHHRKKPLFKILKTVPRGFRHAEVPTVNTDLISAFASEIPSTVIVMLIEHIAIAKSFGRVNNYIINPSQEMIAIGVTNLLAPFLGGYPATGSFSRTAIKSKAGVRTPFAGVITAIVVLLAIYALPAVFFYIPSASLSAVIIHAVGDLITPPNTLYQFWRVNPLEVLIFFAGVFVTIFSSIENGIYTTISISAAILLFHILYAKGSFLGQVRIHSVVGDQAASPASHPDSTPAPGVGTQTTAADGDYNAERATRNLYLPLDRQDGTNPEVNLQTPYPGVFIYRFNEGFNYPSANSYFDQITNVILNSTRRTNPDLFPRLGDRPWNDPGPRRGQTEPDRSHLPTLKAIVLDFSAVNNVDITSVQHLIDVRNQFDRYTAPEKVQWHFANISNRWTKRALASAGFGYPSPVEANLEFTRWKPIFSVADIGGDASAAAAAEQRENKALRTRSRVGGDNIEAGSTSSDNAEYTKEIGQSKAYSSSRVAAVHGMNRPLFHTDLTSAVQSAVANAQTRDIPQGKHLD